MFAAALTYSILFLLILLKNVLEYMKIGREPEMPNVLIILFWAIWFWSWLFHILQNN